jgi:glycosyltransferase involved in cell wall biosynthesis
MGLTRKPTLSVCISTYNRAEWLRASLRNIARLYPEPIEGVEFLVCDNAAQDDTPQVVAPYLLRPDFVYRRNPVNVGMLGNLRETARAANGDYLWILGDDDLIRPGSVERVLAAIRANPGVALVYLNYAYTRIEDARTVVDFERFFADATPIVPPEGDLRGPIREICARNENFFTAIYTLVFRRDHALAAYGQDTSGRPFSTMLTCIPTTYYALNHMMEEPGVWIGEPQLVVNMNVSWMRYAPLWILERIPEVYETAQSKGVPAEDMDRWRRHTLPGVAHFFAEIYGADPLNNAAYFQPARLVARFSHLPEFETYRDQMLEVYRRAHAEGHPAASLPPAVVFGMAQAAAERVEAEPQL